MSVFTIADLHLSSDGSKSMEVFGARWADYRNKLQKNWCSLVKETDSVVLPGDLSWALKLEEAAEDLKFLDSLPGKKYIGKGNHDFWWSTATKMQELFARENISSISILYNNAYRIEKMIICGSRGWFLDEGQQNTVGDVEYEKILNREMIRLRMSLDAAKKLQEETPELPLVAYLHFPPIFGGFLCRPILDLLHEYGVATCYYGHIHGLYTIPGKTEFEGISFRLVSADFLNFTPLLVKPTA
ncbi:MAG: metallophosphoesterase [Clostridia bacterium]|nr:metallophosphoesterase [Clostridia bacterium]